MPEQRNDHREQSDHEPRREVDREDIKRGDDEHAYGGHDVQRQTGHDLREVRREREPHDAHRDERLPKIAAPSHEAGGLMSERAGPGERAALLREVHTELRRADARGERHRAPEDDCQKDPAPGGFGCGAGRGEDAGSDDHAGGEESRAHRRELTSEGHGARAAIESPRHDWP